MLQLNSLVNLDFMFAFDDDGYDDDDDGSDDGDETCSPRWSFCFGSSRAM